MVKNPTLEVHLQRKTIVIFRKKDGEIVHVHNALALAGTTLPPESQLEADAIDIANRNVGRDAGDLAILRVRPEDIEEGVEYRVDAQKQKMVLIEKSGKAK